MQEYWNRIIGNFLRIIGQGLVVSVNSVILHGIAWYIAWYSMVLQGIQWYYMVFSGIAWYSMVLCTCMHTRVSFQ